MRILVVDAFSDRPFGGNPAGVCLLDRPGDPVWMQQVAAEMRHAETAFLLPTPDGPADYELRWFTPSTEVDLCGHATLASAHVLFGERLVPADAPVSFSTRSGVLTAAAVGDQIRMDFPAEPAVAADAPPGLLDALGTQAVWVGRNRFDVLVEVADASVVRGLAPELTALAEIEARGVIVTAAADAGADHDFVSRFFAPRVGVPEDPVTGSAHCALAPFWAERLGRTSLVGVQVSARGGRVGVAVRGDRVELTGQSATVLDGVLVGA